MKVEAKIPKTGKTLMTELIVLFIKHMVIHTMRAMMFILMMFIMLKLYGLTNINLVLVLLWSWSIRIDKNKLNILLM
jgi:hypothetical protein